MAHHMYRNLYIYVIYCIILWYGHGQSFMDPLNHNVYILCKQHLYVSYILLYCNWYIYILFIIIVSINMVHYKWFIYEYSLRMNIHKCTSCSNFPKLIVCMIFVGNWDNINYVIEIYILCDMIVLQVFQNIWHKTLDG